MIKQVSKYYSWIKFGVILLIFLLGTALRLYKYPFYPLVGNAEEYAFVWHGLSLIETGEPISWSMLPPYGKENVVWNGEAPNPAGGSGLGVQLVKPWFDQTPLFSVIVGGIAKFYNQTNFTLISTYIIRIPSLIFSFISMFFVFILARKLFGFLIGIISLMIYATMPTVVFGARLAVPENMIVMLMLVSLWLILEYFETGSQLKRNLSFFLGIIAGFAKATGFLIVPFLVFLMWRQKKWKEGIVLGLTSGFLFFIPYFLYGIHFNKDLFFKITLYQSQRPAGWSSLAYLITNPGFSVEVILDCFLVLGFLSLIFLLFKKRNSQEEVILSSFIFSLLVVMITAGRHDQLAWYRYPIYPFMAISMAIMLKQFFINSDLWPMAIFTPLLLGNIDLLANPFWKTRFFFESPFFRFSFLFLLLPTVIYLFFQKKIWLTISRTFAIFVFILGILINIWVIQTRFSLLCDNESCPLPQKIDLVRPIFHK